jgi:hypothetical protein
MHERGSVYRGRPEEASNFRSKQARREKGKNNLQYFFVVNFQAVRYGMTDKLDCLKQESKLLKFLGFMWNPLSWVMEGAAIVAIVLANGEVCEHLLLSLFRCL